MPKIVKDGNIVDEIPVEMPEELVDILKEKETLTTLTTVDEKGVPHTVYKGSISLAEDGCLAYIEMLEGSQTSKNMLTCYRNQNTVSVTAFNPGNWKSYQVKGLPYKYVVEGPIWEDMRKGLWEKVPVAEPAGVWLIIPKEVRDESYAGRFNEENERLRPAHSQWFAYKDASYAKRHGS